MVYVTIPQVPKHRQITLEQLLYSTEELSPIIGCSKAGTHTYVIKHELSREFERKLNMGTRHLIGTLERFNAQTEHLRSVPRESLYCTFYIPKKNGKYRRIDAPKDELMAALRNLKMIFEEKVQGAIPHFSVRIHQEKVYS